SIAKLVLVMPVTFMKSYFIRRSFLNGWRGFVNSMINAFYAFLKEAKLFEQTMNKDKNK
ncbi:putative lipopolysaccharide core biosynthesis glycosyl transferase LpsC domain protein, partial [Acinetobacter baumannii 25691_7]